MLLQFFNTQSKSNSLPFHHLFPFPFFLPFTDLHTSLPSPYTLYIIIIIFSHHCFADDTQIYLPYHSFKLQSSINTVKSADKQISLWLSFNFYKIGHSKSEMIIIEKPTTVQKCSPITNSIILGDSAIDFASSVKKPRCSF